MEGFSPRLAAAAAKAAVFGRSCGVLDEAWRQLNQAIISRHGGSNAVPPSALEALELLGDETLDYMTKMSSPSALDASSVHRARFESLARAMLRCAAGLQLQGSLSALEGDRLAATLAEDAQDFPDKVKELPARRGDQLAAARRLSERLPEPGTVGTRVEAAASPGSGGGGGPPLGAPDLYEVHANDLELLGERSGFGTVAIYSATGGTKRQEVMVQEISAAYATMPDDLEVLRSELALHVHLRHENVLALLGAITRNSEKACLVLEAVTGGNLHDYLSQSEEPLNPSMAVSFARDIAQGMAYLHSFSIFHRNLETANIFIGEGHCLKISNFGDARARATTEELSGDYMAPELLDDEVLKCDPGKADVYAYAMVLVAILTRQEPWRGLKLSKITAAVLDHHQRPKVPADGGAAPEAVLDVMKQAWSQDPQARPEFSHLVEKLNHRCLRPAEEGDLCAQLSYGWYCYRGLDSVRQDFAEAANWFHLAADQGNALAQFITGVLAEHGKGVAVDQAGAAQWYRLAADQGLSLAQYNLGRCLEAGRGVSPDDAAALRWFHLAAEQGHRKAQAAVSAVEGTGNEVYVDPGEMAGFIRTIADQGNADAQHRMGVMYLTGTGVPMDEQDGMQFIRRAAEQGHLGARISIGVCHARGVGMPEDLAKAVDSYRTAADLDHAPAQFLLGRCYAEGEGVPEDEGEALRWYRLAADQGNSDAQFFLGMHYCGAEIKDEGDGQTKAQREAKTDAEGVGWFRLAAQQKHPQAQWAIGLCYETGIGVTRDFAEALRWLRLSSDQGCLDGMFALGRFYDLGRAMKARNPREGFRLHRLAADQGHAEAQRSVGLKYEIGVKLGKETIIRKSPSDAVRLFRLAADQGYAPAQVNLALCLMKGKGVPVDEVEAVMWLRRAAENGHTDAQFQVAKCYQKLPETPENVEESTLWFHRAAEQGHAQAQFEFATCCELGVGISKDEDKALEFFRLSAKQGNEHAQLGAAVRLLADSKGTSGQSKAAKEAFGYLSQSAGQGNMAAHFNLAMCYLHGVGIRADKREASRHLKATASEGDSQNIQSMMRSLRVV